MYTLIAGSTLAILSAWTTTPASDVFNTGLARHFAIAMDQTQPDCLASTVFVDAGEMLVMLDERGDVLEIDLGGLPDAASTAMASMAEWSSDVEVNVEVDNGVGTIRVVRDGEVEEYEIVLGDLGGSEGPSLGTLFKQMMRGDGRPEVHAKVVIEMDDEDGGRRMQFDTDEIDLGHIMMMVMGDDDDGGVWIADPRGERHRGMRGVHEMHRVMRGQMDDRDRDERRDDFIDQGREFATKLSMASQVGLSLDNAEAVAIFAVWQAREHLDPRACVELLHPMVSNHDLYRSVRNAAAWVVMEAQADLDNREGSAETLRELILRNGSLISE
jgi:hypothetical protein